MKKTVAVAALCTLVMPFAALAQSPSGFNATPSAQPQGFALTTLKSIEEVKQNSYDEQLVVLRGRFTRQVSHDKYEFTDEKGNVIGHTYTIENKSWLKGRKTTKTVTVMNNGTKMLESSKGSLGGRVGSA